MNTSMRAFVWGMVWLVVGVGLGASLPAAEEGGADLVKMIVDLITDQDKEMRAMGLQQVREEAKGPAATKQFAALLPKLAPEAQASLLDALADRGDKAARSAVLEMLKSPAEPVRTAATRALGSLGEAGDVPLLVQMLVSAGPEKTASQRSLLRIQGEGVPVAIEAAFKQAKPALRVELIGVIAGRRAADSIPSILAAAEDSDAAVRKAAVAALGQLGGPEHVPGMAARMLKAKEGPERADLEKAVVAVCSRTKDPDRRAEPLLAAMAQLSEAEKTALLPTLGRVGGRAALKAVEAASADAEPQRREAAFTALCNWPDGSVGPKLLELAQTAEDADHRTRALAALIRVAPLPDKRPDTVRLEMLTKALALTTRDKERSLVLQRARAIRTIETLRFVAPYMEKPEFAQIACETVVELAHHRALREPNKAEFDKALDTVIGTSKDATVIERAQRYKKGQTWTARQEKGAK